MRKGKSINKAIARANEKYPTEALQIDDDTLGEVRAHYEYLAEHEAIIGKLDALRGEIIIHKSRPRRKWSLF